MTSKIKLYSYGLRFPGTTWLQAFRDFTAVQFRTENNYPRGRTSFTYRIKWNISRTKVS
jgi:hypothetical protein